MTPRKLLVECREWMIANVDRLNTNDLPERIDAYLATPEQAEGVMVPVEPTKEMIVAGDEALDDCRDSGYSSDIYGNRYEYETINSDAPAIIYRAMLRAHAARRGEGAT